jgi:uncharacterized protein YihD (DUF1040 family)
MKHGALMRRPINRVGHVLSRLKQLWHYYPELSLTELVREVTFAANLVESDLPALDMRDIEDIAYPESHFLHKCRHLEMGIDALEKEHKDKPLPPVPIQTALIGKVAAVWCKKPQMRLGQFLSQNATLIAEMEDSIS